MFKELSVLILLGVVFADQRLSYETHVACTLPDGRVIEHGEKFEDGCKDCRCDKDTVVCISGARCGNCVYVKANGRTATAQPSEIFWDGCRWCTCGDRATSDCHMSGCPFKCAYKNRDGIDGYAQFFQVWYEGCHRCICRKGWSWQIGMGWAETDCTYDCDQNWLR
ncbi:uncharacterized protein LOC134817964 [Bolinopsis microptera]|uniref:uncharacterized protein LOC134817964 n=1 Tax=Bolinopsis microptera TaxID=2820187 RepID=UPI003079BFA2